MLLVINLSRAAPTFAYDTWFDSWSLLQEGILTIGVLETIVVHLLTRQAKPEVPAAVDQAARIFVPSLYATVVTAMLVNAFVRYYTLDMRAAHAALTAILVIGLIFISLIAYRWYKYQVNVRQRMRQQVLKRLSQVDPNDEKRSRETLTEAFRFFDSDKSGDMSRKELFTLLRVLHPYLSLSQIHEATKGWQGHEVQEEEFLEVIDELNGLCREYARTQLKHGRAKTMKRFSSNRRSSAKSATDDIDQSGALRNTTFRRAASITKHAKIFRTASGRLTRVHPQQHTDESYDGMNNPADDKTSARRGVDFQEP